MAVDPYSGGCLCSVRGSHTTRRDIVSSATIRERLRYRVDRYMSRGGSSLFVSLLLVFFGLLLLIILLRLLLFELVDDKDAEHATFFGTFLEMSDPGRLAEFKDSGRWFRVTAVLATIFGLIFFGALIAILTTTLDRRLTNLRRGHSRVLESGHTLILGWSPQRVVEVVKQLIIANESERHAVVVILADEPKDEMDAHLALHIRDRGTTRLITRSGHPADLAALDIAAADEARSAIVLAGVTSTAPEHRRDDADAQVIKVLLALSSRDHNDELNIVAEIMDRNLHHPARRIWPERITTLCPADILAKILVETSRSVGLSAIYRELLSFDGVELYFESGEWNGASFGSLAYRFDDGIPIGFQAPADVLVELPQNHAGALGATILNPPADHPIGSHDQLLIVASDDSAIVLRDEPVAIPAATSGRTERVTPRTERQLLVGWTAKSRSFIVEYADYVGAGSRIDVIVANENVDPTPELEALAPSLNGTQVEILRLDPTDPDTWDSISPDRYQNIVILADDDDENAELVDAQTILILLLVRDRLPPEDERGDRHIPNLITELVGSENEALARQAGVHDFVVSPSFVSMLLTQISEEPKLYSVYRELFDKQGAEIYLKRADLYFDEMPDAVPFADLMAVAQACGEVCLGVHFDEIGPPNEHRPGLQLHLDKNAPVALGPNDRLVVLAEDET